MKKNISDLTAIRALHQAGKLEEAKKGYLAILKNNPQEVTALNYLGILYLQENNFQAALDCFNKAINIEPQNLSLYLHLANTFKLQGSYPQAITVLQQLIQKNPHYTPAYNNLGSVYFAQGNLTEAIHYYRAATKQQPDYCDAFYNLGLALAKQNQLDEAITAHLTVLTLLPKHAAARFQLARLFMQKEDYPNALKYFLQLEEFYPHHFETQTNLATCYLKLGKLTEAKQHYLQALELTPDDIQILFNLGFISMQLGQIDHAIRHYQQVIQIDPDYFPAHNNLGTAFLAKQHIGYALQHFQEALRLQPHNTAIRYTVDMLKKDQRLLAAPPDYVKNLFNAYADHYEAHLTTALDYKVPDLLFNAVRNITSKNSLDILDLGCGTGLCGVIFKPQAKSLIGVDLSEKMLAYAAKKAIYDELIESNLLSYLTDKHEAFDLVMAGDVFVYMGELAEIFLSVEKILRPAGLFVFNTEITAAENYKMNQSGRFAHSKEYLDQLAIKNNFKIVFYATAVTRMQNNEPVQGHIYVLQASKKSA